MRESFVNLQDLLQHKPELLEQQGSLFQQAEYHRQQHEDEQHRYLDQRHRHREEEREQRKQEKVQREWVQQKEDQEQRYPERVKAGGTSYWRNNSPVAAAAAAVEVQVATLIKKTLAPTSPAGGDKHQLKRKTSVTSVCTVPEMPLEWVEAIRGSDAYSSEISETPPHSKSETRESAVGQGDSTTSYDENYLALVPFKKTETSQELVVYDPQTISEDYVDDEDDDDDDVDDDDDDNDSYNSFVNEQDHDDMDSDEDADDTLRQARSTQSTSLLSLRIPVQMEYVWCNEDFQATSVESDMTIIADGLNFIISR